MYSEWGKYIDHANHEVSKIAQKFVYILNTYHQSVKPYKHCKWLNRSL